MTAVNLRLVGNIILAAGIGLLLVTVAGMAGVVPRFALTKELILFAGVLVVVARGLRRRARRLAV